MKSLSVIYRPQTFQEVCAQEATTQILQKQVALKQFKNAYLFVGPSGVGKTTIARLFAKEINQGCGSPIEIDAASNSGVDNVKALIANAYERSLDSEYKIYIIDECHALSNAAWQAFLKCIEEPPHYTIFLFCTTEVQKVPETITNRVQRFNLARIPTQQIADRLRYICTQEGIQNYEETVSYISRIAGGSLRQAVSYLEKCIDYGNPLNIQDTFKVLERFPLDLYFDLTNMLIDHDSSNLIKLIDSVVRQGANLQQFIEQYLSFVLDLSKYCLLKDLAATSIPSSFLDITKFTTDDGNQRAYFTHLQDQILDIKNALRYDSSPYSTTVIMLLNLIKV